MELLLIITALALGGLLAVQAGANIQLAGAMGSPSVRQPHNSPSGPPSSPCWPRW